jgi:hypothetical protein
MKITSHFVSQVFSRYSFYRPEDYLQIVKYQVEAMPDFVPQRWGYTEPFKNNFNPSKLTDLIPVSDPNKMGSIFWKRTKPRAFGSWFPMVQKYDSFAHAVSSVNIYAKNKSDSLISYLKGICKATKVCYGYLEAVTRNYYPIIHDNGSGVDDSMFLTTHVLVHYLPDMPWAVLFGREYIDMFGEATILTCPAYLVEKVDIDTIYVQLTENPDDMTEHFDMVQSKRQEVKNHLGVKCFYNKELNYKWRMNRNNKSLPYTVPKFQIIDQVAYYDIVSQKR